MRRTRISRVLAGGILIPTTHASDASADAYAIGPPNGGYEPDDTIMDYCQPGGAVNAQPFYDHMDYLYNNTAIDNHVDSPCNQWTDMYLPEALSDPGLWGVYWCENFAGSECNRAHVQINIIQINNDAPSQGVTLNEASQVVWCHEVGHALGLSHRGDFDNCIGAGGLDQPAIYDPNHIGHINNDINQEHHRETRQVWLPDRTGGPHGRLQG